MNSKTFRPSVAAILWIVVLLALGWVAWCAGQPPGPGGGRPGLPPLPVLAALDTDGDGELSAQEIAQATAALKKLDRDGDGRLSREELRPALPGRGPGFGPGVGPPQGPMGPRTSAAFQSPPQPKDDGERKILDVLSQMRSTQSRGMMNVPVEDGRLLRLLAESIGAKTVVEIGTSNGYSGIWFCLALRHTGGKLITHEIDPGRAALARENFAKAGVSSLVTIVEGDAHETVTRLKGPVDLVFIDADKEGYVDYLRKTLPLVRPGGLIVAHNISPRMANPEFVKAITTDPALETVFYQEGAGVSVTLKKR